MNNPGLESFCDLIKFNEDADRKINLDMKDDIEIIWYPGCGGDISPCTILEKYEFEKKKHISFSGNRIYFFTDPDRYHLFEKAHGDNYNIYDLTNSDNIHDRVTVNDLKIEDIYLKSGSAEKITGWYITYSVESAQIRIIYLKMTMQDFLCNYVKEYSLSIKWLFYLNMENKGGPLFNLFEEKNIEYPEWICANRINKFGIGQYVEELLPMEDWFKIKKDNDGNGVMYGAMKRRGNFIEDRSNSIKTE